MIKAWYIEGFINGVEGCTSVIMFAQENLVIIVFTKCMRLDITLINPPGSVHKLHHTMILVIVGYHSPSPTLG